jgi:hypothetical protein
MCGVDIAPEHGHVVDVQHRSLQCVCRPCWMLFTHAGAGGSRLRAVPDRYERLPSDRIDEAQWNALQVPVGLAFFLRGSATGRVSGFYPSPAGATESELSLEAWDDLARVLPALGTLADDVEGLLVRRGLSSERSRHLGTTCAFIVPIDVCYELVGRVRRSWRGFSGGDEAWREIDAFFERIDTRAAGAVIQ